MDGASERKPIGQQIYGASELGETRHATLGFDPGLIGKNVKNKKMLGKAEN
jgi:hypothetical protein